MRKLLLSLTALGGLTLGGLATADAASALPLAGVSAPAQVQMVQYYGGPGRFHRWHRWHHWHHFHHGYYRGY